MFKFINKLKNDHLNNKLENLEKNLNSPLIIEPLSSFAETLLRCIYIDYKHVSDLDINIKLSTILNDSDFDHYLINNYDFNNLLSLNEFNRENNKSKHRTIYDGTEKNIIINGFYNLYDLSRKYISKKTNTNIPELSRQEIVDYLKDANNAILTEDELNNKIQSKQAELEKYQKKAIEQKNLNEQLLKEINDKKINNNKKELKEARERICNLENQNKQILLEKNKSSKEKQELNVELSKKKYEVAILKEELNKYAISKDEYNKKYDAILLKYNEKEKRLKELESESNKFNKTIYSNVNKINNLEQQLEEANKEIKKLNIEKEEANKVSYQNNSDIDRIKSQKIEAERFLNVQNLYKIEKEFNDSIPFCQNCSTQLVIKKNKKNGQYFFGCPNFGKDDKCARTISFTKKQNQLYSDIQQLRSEIYSSSKKFESNFYQNPINQIVKFDSWFFNTLTLPIDIFENHKDNTFRKYSKFQVVSNLDKNQISKGQKLIFTLISRLVNRGVLLKASENIDEAMKIRFNKESNAFVKQIFDSVIYKNPWIKYDSPLEKEFAYKVLPIILKDEDEDRLNSWATYVHPQATFDFINPDDKDNNNFKNQRVDFFVSKNGNQLVFELDGLEHREEGHELLDKERMDYLQVKRGLYTIRMANDFVRHIINNNITEKEENNLSRINGYFKSSYDDYGRVDCDIKYLLAVKLCYQLIIAISKNLEIGTINNIANIRFYSENTMFNQDELDYILEFAKLEIKELFDNYAYIYDVDLKLDLSNKNVKETKIYFGDGNFTEKSIMIRDTYLPYDYLCRLSPIDYEILPKNVDEANVSYFLKYIFGYDAFREGQYEAIRRILLRQNSIVLLPTGAGKSIIYQLSSYIVPGMIIVISPLTSLIDDQKTNLNNKFGIDNVLAIYHASAKEKQQSLTVMKYNNISLLYIAPERLQIPSFRSDIRNLLTENNVYSLAIDEAHCVSEWGHDFRPAYLYISKTIKTLFTKGKFSPSIIGLTGTASTAVLNDIKCDLDINDEESLITPKSFDRKELNYSICKCNESQKLDEIYEIINTKLPERFKDKADRFPGIIFTPLRDNEKKENYSAWILQNNLQMYFPDLKVGTYFSTPPKIIADDELWKEIIKETAKEFKEDKIDILTATKAFGMGIDKPNIRFIIHSGIPISLEQYYQEAGRAGRDRKESQCFIVFSDDNEEQNIDLLNPDITLDQFKEMSKHIGSNDDLNTNLYFYAISFKGVEEELKHIIDIVGKLNLSKDPSEYKTKFFIEEKSLEKENIKAINRLLVLGIIREYEYDYKKTFTIKYNKFNKETIMENYGKYVSKNNSGRKTTEVNKIAKLDYSDKSKFIIDTARILIEYIYDTIEKSRRRELLTMYTVAKESCKRNVKQRDRYIRTQILNYFNSEESNTSIINNIVIGEYCGFDIISEEYGLNNPDKVYDKNEETQAELKVLSIARELGSYPDHPGLLYYLAISQIVSNFKDYNQIVNNISAANKFAKNNYDMNDETINEMFYKTLNISISHSLKLFNMIYNKYVNGDIEKEKKFINDLIDSNFISNENKDILLLKYVDLKLIKGDYLNGSRR